MRTKPSRRALLLGAYGQANLGDDLLLYNYLTLLRSRGYEDVVVNVSRADLVPELITREFPAMTTFATYETSPLTLLRLILSAEVVVYGGGTVYKELYKTTGRSAYSLISRILVFNLLVRLLGKRLYHLHIGLGTLETRLGRLITRYSLYPARYSLLRDQKSYDVAREVLQLPASKLDVSTDVLFVNPRWRTPWRQQPLPLPPGHHVSVIGVNVLHDVPDWIDQQHYVQVMRDFVATQTANGHCIVMLPFQHDFNPHHDLAFMRDHFGDLSGCVILDPVPLDLVADYLQQFDVFVAMRFHSLLLSTAVQTPFAAISYDPKCTRFLAENGYEHVVLLEDLTLPALTALYEQVADDEAGIRSQLAETTQRNFAEAETWLANFRLD